MGGSTITQQVAKNILIGDEYSVTRKLKEMILARRIEGVLTKQQILELYLNEIPLGRRSFGVQAASARLFRQGRGRPRRCTRRRSSRSCPRRPNATAARRTTAWRSSGAISCSTRWSTTTSSPRPQAAAAKAQPLGLDPAPRRWHDSADAGYFLEEVRRQLIGAVRREGRGRAEQRLCRRAVGAHLARSRAAGRGARCAARRAAALSRAGKGWPRADRHDRSRRRATGRRSSISLQPRHQLQGLARRRGDRAQRRQRHDRLLRRQDRAADRPARRAQAPATSSPRRPTGNGWAVRTVPEVSGGFVVEDPHTGRVLAMQGGFDAGSAVQPRDAGAAPAGIDDQAVRLCHRARSRDDPGHDGRPTAPSASTRARAGREMLPQLRRRRRRRAHDALGPRTDRAT